MSQSLVNEGGGARTPLSGLIAGGLILVVVLFFSHLLAALPQPVLAAIVLVAVAALVAVLVPAFTMLSGVSLLERPGPFLATALLANLGFAAAGTLVGALASGLAQRNGLLVLLLLPLVLPVVLGAVQATRSLLVGEATEWWPWAQLLACFAAVFITLGTLVFEFIVED
jgi:heme exporter protein B